MVVFKHQLTPSMTVASFPASSSLLPAMKRWRDWELVKANPWLPTEVQYSASVIHLSLQVLFGRGGGGAGNAFMYIILQGQD